MASFQWKGVFPALLTPFDANDQVDLAVYEKNLDAQVESGIHGIIIAGSLGEASTLSLDEKELLVETENMIKLATEFYDNEILKYEE